MNRTWNTLLGVSAALSLTGAVAGQTLDAGTAQPQDLATNLTAGPDSILRIAEATDFATGVNVTVTVEFFDAVPASIGSEFADSGNTAGAVASFVFIDGADITTGEQFDDAPAMLEIVTIGLSSVTVPAGTVTIEVTVDDGTNSNMVTFAFDDTQTPTMVDAVLNGAGDTLWLVFEDGASNAVPMNNSSVDNAANHTQLATLTDGDDFTVNASPIANAPSAAAFLGAERNIVEFTITIGDVVVGDTIAGLGSDLRSYLRDASSGSVAVRAENPVITAAAWQAALAAGGSGSANLAVTFGEDIDPASVGDQAFWENAGASIDSTTANDLTVDGTSAAGGAAANNIVLDVDSAATSSVAGDGRSDDTGATAGETYDLAVDSGTGTPPMTVFGTPIATGGVTALTIADEIAPSDNGTIGFHDLDGDGVLETIGINFDEPMNASGASAGGFTFNTINTTVHPLTLFVTNLASGETDWDAAANQATLAATATMPLTPMSFATASEDSANRLLTNNIVAITFDMSAQDLDGDGDIDTDDAALFPGTMDTGWADAAFTASTSGLADGGGNAPSGDLGTTTVNDEFASPWLIEVWHMDGENLVSSDPFDRAIDELGSALGDIGDSEDDVALLIYNEELDDAGIDDAEFTFGAEDFMGDYQGLIGAGNNVLHFTDSTDKGFDIGTTISISNANGVVDNSGNDNAVTADTGVALDRTGPYVPLQANPSGAANAVHSAFLNDADDDGFVDTITVNFQKTPDAATVETAADWEVNGTAVVSASLSGNILTLTPTQTTLATGSTHNVDWVGTLVTEDGVPAALVDTQDAANIVARFIAQPTNDGEFTSVMDVFGNIYQDSAGTLPAPAGTRVYGMLAVQRAMRVTGTMNNVNFEMTTDFDEDSMEAITDFLLGLESQLYFYDQNGDMWFDNEKYDEDDFFALMSVRVTGSRGNFRWTASGTTYTDGQSQQQRASARGEIFLCWDVLRSDDGTAADLFDTFSRGGSTSNGFEIDGEPIFSEAVVTGGDGSYLLHMTGPNGDFNGFLDSFGAPVILVVEQVTGEFVYASTVHNATDGLGTLQFVPLQTADDPNTARADGQVDIFLANNASMTTHRGWSLVGNNRDSGFSLSSGDTPELPDGVTETNVLEGTTLNNAPAILQFGFWEDNDNDGVWDESLQDLILDPRCIEGALWFTMTDDGVLAGEGVESVVGGYGLGWFNPSTNNTGIQQLGPDRDPASLAFGVDGFPSSSRNLGWALMTAADDSADAATFLGLIGADFLIEFDRSDDSDTNITTFDGVTSSGDTGAVNGGQAYFLHFPDN